MSFIVETQQIEIGVWDGTYVETGYRDSGSGAERVRHYDYTYYDIKDLTAVRYRDVPLSAYYIDAVNWAVDKGITVGTTATTFSPDATCTVAQILTFLYRAQGSPDVSGANPFTDVSESDYYYKAALWAYEKGLVDNGTLGGGMPCTRAATMLYLWKLAGSPDASGGGFADVPGNANYAQAVSWAVSNGVTTGIGDGTTFSPDTTCTRAQIVTFLYRAMGK